jgi:hypothetical protein
MSTEILLISGLLVALSIYFFWAAYQIQFRNRLDLIQVGTNKRPQSSAIKRQLSTLQLLNGIACVLGGITLAITNSFNPGVWIFVGLSCALSVRRQLLLRAIEIYESKKLAN